MKRLNRLDSVNSDYFISQCISLPMNTKENPSINYMKQHYQKYKKILKRIVLGSCMKQRDRK